MSVLSKTQKCPGCDLPIPADSPFGLCPRCCFAGGTGRSKAPADMPEVSGLEIVRMIGEGSFGRVYECIQDHPATRFIALKVMRTDLLATALRARFLEEVAMLSELIHPNIARLLGSGRIDDSTPYYLMELVHGLPLDKWLLEKKPDAATRLEVMIQICDAVSYAHRQGIVHRDLKPANIIVREEKGRGAEAVVIDFGIARALSGPASWGRAVSQLGQIIGTPMYMSPEQLAGDPVVDTRGDVFSLGLLIYETELGRAALEGVVRDGVSWEENLEALRGHVFPPLPDRELGWIVRKACALDPAERYFSAADLAADLIALREGGAVRAGDPYWKYRLWKLVSAHKAMLGIVLVLVVTMFALLVAGWWVSMKERQSKESIAESMRLEKLARNRAEEAEAAARKTSSDAALVAGSRAMDREDFSEARDQLAKSISLWPGNVAASYTHDFLVATVPFPKKTGGVELPWVPVSVVADDNGGFVLMAEGGEKVVLGKVGEILPAADSTALPTAGTWLHPSKPIRISNSSEGVFTFRDTGTGTPAMANLTYGSGREIATYSPVSQKIIVCGNDASAILWDVSAMGISPELTRFDPPAKWMGFERDTGDLWIIDSGFGMCEWPANGKPGFKVKIRHFGETMNNRWSVGEGHTRGLARGLDSMVGMAQLAGWHLLEGGPKVKFIVQGRLADNNIVVGTSGHIGHQKPGSIFARIVDEDGMHFDKEVELIAIEAHALYGAVVTASGELVLLDLVNNRSGRRWQIEGTAVSITILDGGDIAVGLEDGTVLLFDPKGESPTPRTFRAAGERGGVGGFQIRSVPGKDELLCRMDGDLAIHRFNASTGKPAGPDLRHSVGVDWFCASDDGEFLFSLDQMEGSPGTLRVWSLRTGREIVPGLPHPAHIVWATVLGNGRRIATCDAAGMVRRWLFPEE